MSQEVEELFGRGGGGATPRVALAAVLLLAGLGLTVLGLGCSAVPGGIVVLLGWLVVEQDSDRLESGFLPSDSRSTVRLLRVLSVVSVLIVFGLLAAQFWLLATTPIYEMLWNSALHLAGAMRSAAMPAPVPAP